jgi:hypothetical protein
MNNFFMVVYGHSETPYFGLFLSSNVQLKHILEAGFASNFK